MQQIELTTSERLSLRKILLRFALDADRRSRGATIDTARILHWDARTGHRDRSCGLCVSRLGTRIAGMAWIDNKLALRDSGN
jgi:hypothetical protein